MKCLFFKPKKHGKFGMDDSTIINYKKYKKKERITGFFGIIISISFILSFSIIYIFFIPPFLIDETPIIMYNIENIPGKDFIKYIAYFFTGLLIVFFNISLIKNTDNSETNITGKICLLISGIFYSSLGVINFSNEWDDLNMFQSLFTLPIGILGLFFLCFDFEKISKSYKFKKGLIIITFYLIIESIVNFIFIINNYPYNPIIAKLSWLIYFTSFGFIGLSLLFKR